MAVNDHNQNRIELADRVLLDLGLENRLSPSQARSFVRGLQTTWQVPPIQWGESESYQQLDDARRLLHAAEIFSLSFGRDHTKSIDCYRRAGEILEWLTRAKDSIKTVAPIELFAAAAFQLGRLPAMANALLGQTDSTAPGIRLYSSFFKADFDSVLEEISSFWIQNPRLTSPNASRGLLSGNEGSFEWYFTVELVRCIGLVADSLRRGNNTRLEQALHKLKALDKFATRSFAADASLLVSLIHGVAVNYYESSIYTPIRQLANINPSRTGRLEIFARGQFSRGRGILWQSQIQGLSRLLHSSSFALCTPTGSGKTLVANLAIVKELLLDNNEGIAPLCLYLVPSRALAGEVEAKLHSELGHDVIVTGLYGGSDWGITDYWLNADRPTVLIVTVEKADALMRYVGPILLSRLKLLIVDEAHQVVPDNNAKTRKDMAEHTSRAIRLESFVSRLLALFPNIARIALTAVAGGASSPVARWIEGNNDAQAIGTRYRSTRQVIGSLDSTPTLASRISLDLMNGRQLYVRGRDEPVFIPLRIPPMPQLPARMRNSIYRYNSISVLWTALHLIDADRRILISVAQSPEKIMRWYKEALELPEWENIAQFEIPNASGKRELFQEARATCIDYCGEDAFEVALLDRGIATNHGQMPQRLRRLMVALIDQRVCPITLATATLTEGVNLPFDLIFITSLKRSSFDEATQQQIEVPMSISEFKNLAGRAGRPGSANSIEGMTLVALPKRPSTTASATLNTQRQQIIAIEQEYDALIQSLIADEVHADEVDSPLAILISTIYRKVGELYNMSGDEFLNWLDAIRPEEISEDAGLAENNELARLADSLDELDGILLAAVEEIGRLQNQTLERATLESLLTSIWRSTFTKYAAHQEELLENAYIKRGVALIENIYPDVAERKRLYQYGFSPYVGRRFELIASDVKSIIEEASNFGVMSDAERVEIFQRIGTLIIDNQGFGFRVPNTVSGQELLQNWTNVLSWWMQSPQAPSPEPINLRSWQRFVSDNLEFRLGVVIGAVVAQTWSDGSEDPFAVPSLASWRQTTGLPWFGFWARELLRWGTLDPFVAFVLAQGLSSTRNGASELRNEFEQWLNNNYVDINEEDLIDPQIFLQWQRSLSNFSNVATSVLTFATELTGTNGDKQTYDVIPISGDNAIKWIDPAGYELASTDNRGGLIDIAQMFKSDFLLKTGNQPHVEQVFRGQ